MDANRGRVVGEIQRITDGPSADVRPTVSADGRKIAFRSDRTGAGEIWIRNPLPAKKTMVSSGPGYKHHALLSLDGSTVVYAVAAEPRPCYSVPYTEGKPEKIAEECYVVKFYTGRQKCHLRQPNARWQTPIRNLSVGPCIEAANSDTEPSEMGSVGTNLLVGRALDRVPRRPSRRKAAAYILRPFERIGTAPVETWIAVAGPPGGAGTLVAGR